MVRDGGPHEESRSMIWFESEDCPMRPTFATLLVLMAADPFARAADDRSAAHLGSLIRVVAEADSPALQSDLLAGAIQGLAGRKVPIPAEWPSAYLKLARSPEAGVRRHAHRLALILGDPEALAAM